MSDALPNPSNELPAAQLPRDLWLLRALTEYIPAAAFFVVDQDFRYLLAGGTALVDAGMTPENFEGKLVADVVPPELLGQYLADYTAIFAGKPFVREHPVAERFYTTHGKLIKGIAGSRDVALAISYDITHERTQDFSRR